MPRMTATALSVSLLLPALLLSGCGSSQQAPDNTDLTANQAETNSVPMMVENVSEPASANVLDNMQVDPVGPANASDNSLITADLPTPAGSGNGNDSGEGTDASAAKQVVQRYYAAISGGDYAAARKYWENGGDASGRSAEAFAKQFDRYSSFQADIGAPGRIDAGAGQRHVDVPVTLHGTMRGGATAFRTKAVVTLHRTAAVDGASADQQRWHIAKITMPQGSTGT